MCVVGLPYAKQSDLRLLAFVVILSIYTDMCFGIYLYYFNIALLCSLFCDLQMIANDDIRKADKTLFYQECIPKSVLSATTLAYFSIFSKFYLLLIQFIDEFLCIFCLDFFVVI